RRGLPPPGEHPLHRGRRSAQDVPQRAPGAGRRRRPRAGLLRPAGRGRPRAPAPRRHYPRRAPRLIPLRAEPCTPPAPCSPPCCWPPPPAPRPPSTPTRLPPARTRAAPSPPPSTPTRPPPTPPAAPSPVPTSPPSRPWTPTCAPTPTPPRRPPTPTPPSPP